MSFCGLTLIAIAYRAMSQGNLCAVGGWNSPSQWDSVECYNGTVWSTIAPMSRRRDSVAAVVYGGNLCAIGGHDGSLPWDSVECYNGMVWNVIAPMNSRRQNAAAVLYNGNLCAIGGYNGSSRLDSVECYDGTAWNGIAPMNSRRYAGAAVVYNGNLCAIGGDNGSSYLDSVECYDGTAWNAIAQMNSRRFAGAAVVYNDNLCVIGGSNGSSRLDSVECYDGTAWNAIAPMNNRRFAGAAVVYSGNLCAIGGYNGASRLDSVECYDGTAWNAIAPMNNRRERLAAVVYNAPTAVTWPNEGTIVIEGDRGVVVTVSQDPAWGGGGVLLVRVGSPIVPLHPSVSVLSEVISIDLVVNGSLSPVSSLQTPILIKFPLVINASFYDVCEKQKIVRNTKEPACASRTAGNEGFATAGCKVYNVTDTAVVCACAHLTEFVVIANKPTREDVRNLGYILDYPTPLITVCVVLGLFCLASIGAAVVDHGKDTLAAVERKRKKWKWEAEFNIEKDLPQLLKAAMQHSHPWFAVFFRPTGSSFRSKDRCLCLLVSVLFNMCVTAGAWQPHRQSATDVLDRVISDWDIVLQAILASVVAAIIREILEQVFSRVGPLGFRAAWKREQSPPPTTRLGKCAHVRLPLFVRTVLLVLCAISVVIMCVVIMLLGLQFDLNARFFCNNAKGSRSWILTFCVSTLVHAVFVTPAWILLKTWLSRQRKKQKPQFPVESSDLWQDDREHGSHHSSQTSTNIKVIH